MKDIIVKGAREQTVVVKDTKHIPKAEIPDIIKQLEVEMRKAADNLDFELAITFRQQTKKLKERLTKE